MRTHPPAHADIDGQVRCRGRNVPTVPWEKRADTADTDGIRPDMEPDEQTDLPELDIEVGALATWEDERREIGAYEAAVEDGALYAPDSAIVRRTGNVALKPVSNVLTAAVIWPTLVTSTYFRNLAVPHLLPQIIGAALAATSQIVAICYILDLVVARGEEVGALCLL